MFILMAGRSAFFNQMIIAKIASASWTPSGRNFTILAMVLGGSSDSPKTGAAAADQAA